jgi:AAA domain
MSFQFRPAKRENVPLLIGIAGGTGSGKTMSALRLATGLVAAGEQFAVIDTENRRALHYADAFKFDHTELGPPFRPERYLEAIEAAAKSYRVIVVDSFSHEYAGDGGLLDWHEDELDRIAGSDLKKREAAAFSAWVRPKMEHKKLVTRLLQLNAHLIVCLRAEEKIEIVRGKGGKIEVVPKRTLAGHVGWIPVAEKSFAYELTLSLVLTPDEPGIPKPIKLQEQHKPFLPLDQPISEETGRRLAEWAQGSEGEPQPAAPGTGRAGSPQDPADARPAASPSGDPFEGLEQQPPGPLKLTPAQLKRRIESSGVPQPMVAELGARMFKGKAGTGSLTDAERGELWQAVVKIDPSIPV